MSSESRSLIDEIYALMQEQAYLGDPVTSFVITEQAAREIISTIVPDCSDLPVVGDEIDIQNLSGRVVAELPDNAIAQFFTDSWHVPINVFGMYEELPVSAA